MRKLLGLGLISISRRLVRFVSHDKKGFTHLDCQCRLYHMNKNVLSGAQIRAARALLRWSAENLAEKAKLGRITVSRAEAVDGATSLTAANVQAIRSAFEANGVEFIDQNGGGPGVRLRSPQVDPPG